MRRASEPTAPRLRDVVDACRARPDALDALRRLYRRADAETADRGLACSGCGVCCRFETAGHRLLATSLELALLTEQPPPGSPAEHGNCPYQRGARCAARARRPLGCRLYFCSEDPTAGAERYERYHRAVRRLHGEHGLPYAYAEAPAAVAALLSPAAEGQNSEFAIDTPGPAV